MINKNLENVLREILLRLEDKNIKWALVGSTASALQNLRINPRDIDIITDKNGSYKIEKLLLDYRIQPIKFRRTHQYSSYFGLFRINSIDVEVMGNLLILYRDIKFDYSPKSSLIKKIRFEHYVVPVVSLENQLIANLLIEGQKERVYKLANHLKRHGASERYFLNLRKREGMKEVVERARSLLR